MIQSLIVRGILRFLDNLLGFQNTRGHTFYSKGLNPTSTVLDLGANLGGFSKCIESKHKCRVFAVEASPELFGQIEETPLVRKLNYAVTGQNGFVTFYESTNIEAGNIVGPKSNSTGNTFEVESRSFANLISEIDLKEIDLLKIDIEGAEIALFDNVNNEDLNLVKQITIEFHDSVPIPNISTKDVERIIKKIVSMGFEGMAMGYKNLNWLFINKNKKILKAPAKSYLTLRKQLTKRFT